VIKYLAFDFKHVIAFTSHCLADFVDKQTRQTISFANTHLLSLIQPLLDRLQENLYFRIHSKLLFVRALLVNIKSLDIELIQ